MSETRTPTEALLAARRQSDDGPAFGVNECKQRVRELYSVPSDGSPDATAAWHRTQHRHSKLTPLEELPPGALVWWTGGAAGRGHVALYAGKGRVWSTDIKRAGRFDLVSLSVIADAWPSLDLVGWSEDIDGVRVLHPSLGRIGQARKLLKSAAADETLPHARRARARAALVALRKDTPR